MRPITIPQNYNYIGVFLTLGCNYRCSYCINYFENSKFNFKNATGQDWVRGLNRIVSRDDLPVTLQGGEPSMHKDFIYIINNLNLQLNIDILTNIQFDVEEFISKVKPSRLYRKAPYASIRVSFHPKVMDLDQTIKKVLKMKEAGFYIGIWGVLHPKYKDIILSAQKKCLRLGIDFRTKEFLGFYNGQLEGTYRYKDACLREKKRNVLCKTTEFLIAPNLEIYRCHSDLYAQRNSIGNLLNPDFEIEDKFRSCQYYVFVIPVI